MVWVILIPMKNGYFIGNIPYFQTIPYIYIILATTYRSGPRFQPLRIIQLFNLFGLFRMQTTGQISPLDFLNFKFFSANDTMLGTWRDTPLPHRAFCIWSGIDHVKSSASTHSTPYLHGVRWDHKNHWCQCLLILQLLTPEQKKNNYIIIKNIISNAIIINIYIYYIYYNYYIVIVLLILL